MSGTINEILGTAASQLLERERRLEAIIRPAQEELAEVRKALKRLTGQGGGSRKTPAASRNATLDAGEKRRRVVEVLEVAADGDPLSTTEIASRAGIGAQGLHLMLGHMKKEQIVAEPEQGLWLSTKAPRFDTGRERKEPKAA